MSASLEMGNSSIHSLRQVSPLWRHVLEAGGTTGTLQTTTRLWSRTTGELLSVLGEKGGRGELH